jgi:hypothetical protein
MSSQILDAHLAPRILEHRPQPRLRLAVVRPTQLRTVHDEHRCLGGGCYGSCEMRLASARWAVEKNATRRFESWMVIRSSLGHQITHDPNNRT